MEAVLLEVLDEQVAHVLADSLDGLLQWGALVHDDVIEVCVKGGRQAGRRVANVQLLHLAVNVEAADGSVGRSEGQAEHLGAAGNAVDLGDVELVVGDLAALDGLEGLRDGGFNGDVALEADRADPLGHLLGNWCSLGRRGDNALDAPVLDLAQLDEAHLGALHPALLNPRAELDRLAEVLVAISPQCHLLAAQLHHITVAVVVLGLVVGGLLGSVGSPLGLQLGCFLRLFCLLLCLCLGLL